MEEENQENDTQNLADSQSIISNQESDIIIEYISQTSQMIQNRMKQFKFVSIPSASSSDNGGCTQFSLQCQIDGNWIQLSNDNHKGLFDVNKQFCVAKVCVFDFIIPANVDVPITHLIMSKTSLESMANESVIKILDGQQIQVGQINEVLIGIPYNTFSMQLDNLYGIGNHEQYVEESYNDTMNSNGYMDLGQVLYEQYQIDENLYELSKFEGVCQQIFGLKGCGNELQQIIIEGLQWAGKNQDEIQSILKNVDFVNNVIQVLCGIWSELNIVQDVIWQDINYTELEVQTQYDVSLILHLLIIQVDVYQKGSIQLTS